MSEFNVGRYQLDDNKQIAALETDQLMTAEQVVELLKANNPNAIIGDGGNLFELAPQFAKSFTQIYPNAVDILPIAQQQLSDGLAVNIETVDLVYLRGTDAWQKRKRLRTAEQGAS
jgi:tRNA threonylcarbamoyladenosine biosynthesis protein TsaB